MRQFAIALLLLGSSMGGVRAQTPAPAGPDIAFGPDGSVSSLVLETGGENVVDLKKPGRGFYVTAWANGNTEEIRLAGIRRQGNTLVVSRGDALPRFTFEVRSNPRYLALKLVRAEGLPPNQPALRIEIRCRAGVVARGLDYMTSGQFQLRDRMDVKVVEGAWKFLWHGNPKDPLGAIALYPAGDPDKEDEALLEVWVNEDLPKPAIKDPWTKERARQWLDECWRLYGDQTMMVIAAQSPEELYAMTDVAERAGVKSVYLHTDTWRGDYWPIAQSHVYVNPKVFPKGLDDLKKYAAHLRQRGMYLCLHTTSGGIGPSDTRRIAGHVTRELASWGAGALEESVTPAATQIRFRPARGTCYPSNLPRNFTPVYARLDDEIIQVGAFEDTDRAVWTLKGCIRGVGATKAASHAGGAELVGLISAYGQNFVPDVDSALMEEIAGEFADLANAIGLGRLEYDAAEINGVPPWGINKYNTLVTRRLDHPVISNNSGGRPAWSNIELWFNRCAALRPPPCTSISSFTTETGFRRATPEFEFNTSLAKIITEGLANKLIIQKSQAMFGINQAMLAGHGLSAKFLEDFRLWHAAGRLATKEQRAALKQALDEKPAGKLTLIAPHHFIGGFVGAGIRETPDAYEVAPVRILARPTDAPATLGVEAALVSPRQFVKPGQILEFNNPNAPQPLTWTIRVLPEVEPCVTPTQAKVTADGPTILDSYLTGVAGANQGAQVKHPLDMQPWGKPALVLMTQASLQPKADEVRNQAYAKYAQDGDGVVVSAENPRDQAFMKEDDLPSWARTVAMPGHGLSLDVTGDGSGAVLVIQLSAGGVRDYVVKIDFTGKRTIVIPTGEVSWADGNWGRRPGTERFSYGVISGVAMGFGYIPAKASPRVKVENLQLLEDRPSKLINPVVALGAGELQVSGEVESGQYLHYTGGDTAGVYDENWHLLKQLPVTRRDYLMPSGKAPVSVKVAPGAPSPWLETQFFSEGAPIRIPKEGSAGL
jgi:hypothetical protein